MSNKDELLNDDLYDEDEDTMEDMFLTFGIENREYGLEVKNVIEITGLKTFTEVPDMPDYVKGIINLRGKIIPLVDVRTRFNSPEIEYHDRTCVIIVTLRNELVGLIVDGVSEVLKIAESQLEEAPTIGENHENQCIKLIGKVEENVKLILNLEKFLGENHFREMQAAADARGEKEKTEVPETVSA